LRKARIEFIPEDAIPTATTERLHRWGYAHYREMFSARQLLGPESIVATDFR
jgi:adenine-specific DNA methylase